MRLIRRVPQRRCCWFTAFYEVGTFSFSHGVGLAYTASAGVHTWQYVHKRIWRNIYVHVGIKVSLTRERAAVTPSLDAFRSCIQFGHHTLIFLFSRGQARKLTYSSNGRVYAQITSEVILLHSRDRSKKVLGPLVD